MQVEEPGWDKSPTPIYLECTETLFLLKIEELKTVSMKKYYKYHYNFTFYRIFIIELINHLFIKYIKKIY
jgi:hypothetical protein